MAKKLYVISGEHSGDAHGAGLLESLLTEFPNLTIAGAGGPKMRALAGSRLQNWVEDAAVMGFWEVLKHYGWFRKKFNEMLLEIHALKPEVLLLIDYPGFNLRFAKAVKQQLPKTRIIYYISPQVWAWNRGRIPSMARCIDEMMCLFPFEVDLFSSAGLKTSCVGHPLIDELRFVKEDASRESSLVGLFPGSREREVTRLFSPMLRAARQLIAQGEMLRFEAAAASERLAQYMVNLVSENELENHVTVTIGKSHSLMQRASCGIVASGTATLEAAYFGLPYGLVYKVAWPTYILGRMLIKVPYIGLVNILAQRQVVKEWIQADARPSTMATAIKHWIDQPEEALRLSQELQSVAEMLGGAGAHARAAKVVAHWLNETKLTNEFKKN